MAAVEWQMAAQEAQLNRAPAIHVPSPLSQVQCWFPASPLPFQPTDIETDTRDTHNKHLESFPSTSVINEPGYPQSSRVGLDARSGFVTNGAL